MREALPDHWTTDEGLPDSETTVGKVEGWLLRVEVGEARL